MQLLVASSVSLLPHTGHGHWNGVSCEFSDRFPRAWFPVLRGSRFSCKIRAPIGLFVYSQVGMPVGSPVTSSLYRLTIELASRFTCRLGEPAVFLMVLPLACRSVPWLVHGFSCRLISAVDSLVCSLAQCLFYP